MNILSFSHYNLRAPRELLDALCSFYTEVVGLRVGRRPPFMSFGYWLYAGQQDVLHLTEARNDEVRSIEATTTFDHAAFNCTGREKYEIALAQRGVKYEVSHVPQTGQVQLFFKDPAGNGVELNFTSTDA
jgi:catechol-2,3-dioxygenase